MKEDRDMLVSVITPCYRDGAFLSECHQTVLAQTYPQVEWIVVDDGSDDTETQQALDILEKQGVKVLHVEHAGPAAARNRGISEAHGKWILPLDADDLLDPAYISKAVDAMQQDMCHRVVYCQADFFGLRSGSWPLPPFSVGQMLVDNVVFVTALFYRDDWQQIGGFPVTEGGQLEDYDFWLTLLEHGATFHQLPETLFHYRIRPGSRTSHFTSDETGWREIYRLLYRKHASLYEQHRAEYMAALRASWIDQRIHMDHLNKENVRLREQEEAHLEMIQSLQKQINIMRAPCFFRWMLRNPNIYNFVRSIRHRHQRLR